MSNTVICLEKRESINIVEVPNVTITVTTIFSVVVLIVIIILVIILLYYYFKKRTLTKSTRVVPIALIAAALGRVSPLPPILVQ